MEDGLLRFRNPQTGNYPQKIQTMDGFAGWAYDDCAKFAEKSETAPTLADALIPAELIPEEGESRFVLVRYPFAAAIGETVNVMFGMDAVVSGTFERVLCADEEKAWIEMRITQVEPIDALIRNHPPIESSVMTDEIAFLVDYMEQLDPVPGVELYVGNDVWECAMLDTTLGRGEWFLIHHDKEGKTHLVLYGVYNQHLEFVQFGNCMIRYRLCPSFYGERKQDDMIMFEDSPLAQSIQGIMDALKSKTENA